MIIGSILLLLFPNNNNRPGAYGTQTGTYKAIARLNKNPLSVLLLKISTYAAAKKNARLIQTEYLFFSFETQNHIFANKNKTVTT